MKRGFTIAFKYHIENIVYKEQMLKRLLNIALIFSLVLSIIGVSTSKTYCVSMNKVMEKSCCDSHKTDGCCKQIKELNRFASDLSIANATVELPNVLLFVDAPLYYLDFSAVVLNIKHSFSSYNPPLITQDIPVLFQVFRI